MTHHCDMKIQAFTN